MTEVMEERMAENFPKLSNQLTDFRTLQSQGRINTKKLWHKHITVKPETKKQL